MLHLKTLIVKLVSPDLSGATYTQPSENFFFKLVNKEISDDGVEVAPESFGFTNLNITVFKCIKSWCFLNYIWQ
jgi:hypothetical protein